MWKHSLEGEGGKWSSLKLTEACFGSSEKDVWNGMQQWDGKNLRSTCYAHKHRHTLDLQPLWNMNWKQIKSHNKPFCARSKEESYERNSCSGKIDAKRKISDTFLRRSQSRDFQRCRSMNENLFLFVKPRKQLKDFKAIRGLEVLKQRKDRRSVLVETFEKLTKQKSESVIIVNEKFA